MSETNRLGLPFLDAGQAAKELTHNEALVRLDLAVQASVVALGENVPPDHPEIGQAWIVGTMPTADWIGHAQAIAGWTVSGWRFLEPIEGMVAWVEDAKVSARFLNGSWTVGDLVCNQLKIGGLPVVRARAEAVAEPSEGATIDTEARVTIGGILRALRYHGLIAV